MKLEAIGPELKKRRQELGVSLEEAQKKTKIQLSILKAIEGDGLTHLNPVYLKGFLKIYCKFLGLDFRDYGPDEKEAQSQPQQKDAKKPTEFFKAASEKIQAIRPSRKIKKTFIFILAAIFISVVLFNIGKAVSLRYGKYVEEKRVVKKNTQKQKDEQQNKAAGPKQKALNPKEKHQAKQPLPKKDSLSGIRLGVRARENCWVFLKIDGKVVFQRVLEKGRFESWQAKEKIELSLGNAIAVELEVNGQLFSNLGRKGQALKNILITKEGLSIGK